MLTLFTLPKPFVGRTGAIQRNALRSWRALDAEIEILVFGDEEGSAEAARDVHAGHLGAVNRSERGTPLIDRMFATAQAAARYDLMVYVNADVILLDDLLPAYDAIAAWRRNAPVVARRQEAAIDRELDIPGAAWQADVRAAIAAAGETGAAWGIDFIGFPRGLYDRVPPFAIGRGWWDNWLTAYGKRRGGALLDATAVVTVAHQTHTYAHVAGGQQGAFIGVESMWNRELMGGWRNHRTIAHATHRLTSDGRIRRALGQPLTADRWYWRQRFARATTRRLLETARLMSPREPV